LSNVNWQSPTDPDAKIAKLKDGRTRLAHKPEYAVDLDTGAVIAAELHAADRKHGTLPGTLAAASRPPSVRSSCFSIHRIAQDPGRDGTILASGSNF
jgi:hypothetical protein